MYHKDFPWNKGAWIWRIDKCLDGTIDSIIQKCHDYDISYLIIKGGDGGTLYPSGQAQLTRDVVIQLQNAGIKVYSWSYNYGESPQAEADVAIKCLDLGVSGHVFDAESEFKERPGNVQAAETMFQIVRAKYPNAFLAYAPYAIIDFHTKFPYITFGKYCDAVMPQVYYGNWLKTEQDPQKGILWMYDNFVRWQKNWIENGHEDSVKPIIPIAQSYDSSEVSPPYVLKPADIHAFVSTVKGYKSVNFWSFQHILRNDCWEALRDAKVDPPSDFDRGLSAAIEVKGDIAVHDVVIQGNTETQPPQATTEVPVSEQPPVVSVEEMGVPLREPPVVHIPEGTVTIIEPPIETVIPITEPLEGVTVITPEAVEAAPPVDTESTTVTPQQAPQTVNLSPDSATAEVSVGQKTTIVIDPDADHPDGVRVTITTHKTHQDYFVAFITYIYSLFISLLRGKK